MYTILICQSYLSKSGEGNKKKETKLSSNLKKKELSRHAKVWVESLNNIKEGKYKGFKSENEFLCS